MKKTVMIFIALAIVSGIGLGAVYAYNDRQDMLSYLYLNSLKYLDNNKNVEKYDQKMKEHFDYLSYLREYAFEKSDLGSLRFVNKELIDLEINFLEQQVQKESKIQKEKVDKIIVEEYNVANDRKTFNELKKDTLQYFDYYIKLSYEDIKSTEDVELKKINSVILEETMLNEEQNDKLFKLENFYQQKDDVNTKLVNEQALTTELINFRKSIDGLFAHEKSTAEQKEEIEKLKREGFDLINSRSKSENIKSKIVDIQNKINEYTPIEQTTNTTTTGSDPTYERPTTQNPTTDPEDDNNQGGAPERPPVPPINDNCDPTDGNVCV